ncbi:MAG: class I SAM-dependent methyltransferase [Patescibacteria group bacterium]|jgi:hypothetical protein|nr:class I SAM-dependent methyltransferase [Patescibacteria group bacterium]
MLEHDVSPGKLERCQITGSTNLFEAIDLGHQPPCDALLTDKTMYQTETYYPLRLMICPDSGLAQLDHVVDGKVLYPHEYPYRAGVSKPLQDYLRAFSDHVVKGFNIPKSSLCVDVGCNDGALLSGFKKHGQRTVGVEPTNMGRYAKEENNIDVVIQDFFTEEVAKYIAKEHGKAKVVTMTNVFAHMATLGQVMRGLDELLDKDGIFITESQYLLDIFERNQFDQAYHEHLRLYSVKSLVKLFEYYGMEVFDAQRVTAREGSIRAYIARKGARPISPNVTDLLKDEEDKELFKPETWVKWRKRIEENKARFMELAYSAKAHGLRFVADSCPGRGTVLINYYGLNKDLLPYIAQLPDSEKVGKFMPGTHIPVVGNDIILKEQPDYIVILAWHYGDYIMKNWRAKGVTSKFVMPLPELRIIED